jgi:hypothetical protein
MTLSSVHGADVQRGPESGGDAPGRVGWAKCRFWMTRRTGALARRKRERSRLRCKDPIARRTMLEVAVHNDVLAERAERRNDRRPKP